MNCVRLRNIAFYKLAPNLFGYVAIYLDLHIMGYSGIMWTSSFSLWTKLRYLIYHYFYFLFLVKDKNHNHVALILSQKQSYILLGDKLLPVIKHGFLWSEENANLTNFPTPNGVWVLNRVKLKTKAPSQNNNKRGTNNSGNNTKNNQNPYIVVPFTRGLSESLKKVCSKHGDTCVL